MIDTEVLYSPGFIILALGAIIATVVGYIVTLKGDMAAFGLGTLLIIIAGEIAAAYYFASR